MAKFIAAAGDCERFSFLFCSFLFLRNKAKGKSKRDESGRGFLPDGKQHSMVIGVTCRDPPLTLTLISVCFVTGLSFIFNGLIAKFFTLW